MDKIACVSSEASVYALDTSASQQLALMESRFASRGLAKAVKQDAEEQERKEAQTRAAEPLCYRLSTLSTGAINGRYRLGKEHMSTRDLLQYFGETRAIRTKGTDFSTPAPSDDAILCGEQEKSCVAVVKGEATVGIKETVCALPEKIKHAPVQIFDFVRASHTSWFDFSRVNTDKETRRFPLSAFASIFVVAMCLFLIVAGSVMVHDGESRVNLLSLELDALSGEISEIRSDLDVKTDLLQIRRVATEEYDMVGEQFLRMDYLSNDNENSVEVFEAEKEPAIGIGALLSAIGFR